jgi:hypothetical protein
LRSGREDTGDIWDFKTHFKNDQIYEFSHDLIQIEFLPANRNCPTLDPVIHGWVGFTDVRGFIGFDDAAGPTTDCAVAMLFTDNVAAPESVWRG